MVSGDEYSGDWKDGKRHGHGVYNYRYVPHFNAKRVTLCSDGDRYEGEWRNDERHGRGTMVYNVSNSNVQEKYEGEWVDGKMHGRHTLLFIFHIPYLMQRLLLVRGWLCL